MPNYFLRGMCTSQARTVNERALFRLSGLQVEREYYHNIDEGFGLWMMMI